MARVTLASAIGPGLITYGTVWNYLHGVGVVQTVGIVYGAITTILGVASLFTIGFDRTKWLREVTVGELKERLICRDKKIEEMYAEIDSVRGELKVVRERLASERAVNEKLSSHILDEKKPRKRLKPAKER